MIIVTGGAGFIGSCLVRELNNNGIYDILIVDRLRNASKWKNLLGKRFTRYIDKDDFRIMFLNGEFDNEKIETIFHIGACSSTTETDCDYLFENNYNNSIDLAQFALTKNIRFIYASSAATYGDGSNGYSDNEFYGLMRLNPYGMTKHLFDLWVIQNGFDKILTGLKFFNVFGPNEYHKDDMASMVYKSFLQIKEKGYVKLFKSNTSEYPDGGQMRDFVYVKDVTKILIDIYNNKAFSGIYNIGTGNARNWNDLVKAVFNAMNLEPEIEYIDMPEQLSKQYQNFTEADMSKLKSSNPLLSFMELEESVEDYVKNYLLKEQKIL